MAVNEPGGGTRAPGLPAPRGDGPPGTGPLSGVTVLDLAQSQVGQAACTALADQGADVIAVGRAGYPAERGMRGLWTVGRGKRSIMMDLAGSSGHEVFGRLAARADVIVDGFRPGTLERLGVGFDWLRSIRPDIIVCAVSGWGAEGPYAQLPGHDLNFQAVAGSLPVDTNGSPLLPQSTWATRCAALQVPYAIVLALLHRATTGVGGLVDVAIADAALTLPEAECHLLDWAERVSNGGPPGGAAPLRGDLRGNRPWYQLYRCADGSYIAVGCVEPRHWRRFCELIGRPALAAQQHGPLEEAAQVTAEVASVLATKPRAAWLAQLQPECPVAPVNHGYDVTRDPHLLARGSVAQVGLPGGQPMWQVFAGPRIGDHHPAAGDERSVTVAGQHSVAILRELGYRDDQISDLLTRAVVHQVGPP
jgi:alpha-methylacyl-CoA racemase